MDENTREAIQSVVETLPNIDKLKPEQEQALLNFVGSRPVPAQDIRHDQTLCDWLADPEWHWADPIVLNFNRHPPSSELTFVN